MIGSSRDGYYPCLQLEHFHDRTIVITEPSENLAAGPVHTAKLRVDQNAGAGLQLSVCEAGYLVEEVDDWPGQPDIRARDVIVAAGEELLIGLKEEKMEESLKKVFENGVLLTVGNLDLLLKINLEEIRRATTRLLRPWSDRSSVTSVGSVLVTSPAAVPRGRRHRFRSTANEFRPDPLAQPGGDPWANAAANGYVYPEYTGWGTKFKKKKATIVNSTRFLKPKQEEHQQGFHKEFTKVHQRINQTLQRASQDSQPFQNRSALSSFTIAWKRSWEFYRQEKVLSIVSEQRGLLSKLKQSKSRV